MWLYIDRVKEGYARKLAHRWHGPSRVVEGVDTYSTRLEIVGAKYRLFPVVHVSKLEPDRTLLDRTRLSLTIQNQDRFDFFFMKHCYPKITGRQNCMKMSTKWSVSPICDLDGALAKVVYCETYWCTGRDTTIHRGSTKLT